MSLQGSVSSFVAYKQDNKVDFSTPQGMAGRSLFYILNRPNKGLTKGKMQVFVTYKQDDKVNLWEGTDASISGIASSYVAYRPHDGVRITPIAGDVNYRPHDGLDIRKLDAFMMEKHEDWVETFRIPYGIGGSVHPYITMRVHTLVGGVSLEGTLFPVKEINALAVSNISHELKEVGYVNIIPFGENNTGDETDEEKEG